jgi:uridylate kinase
MKELIYRRILVKLGGEALAGPGGFGIDPMRAEEVAKNVQKLLDLDIEVVARSGWD